MMEKDDSRSVDVDDYVCGRMDRDRRLRFEEEMAANPELTEEVNELRRLMGVLSDLSDRDRAVSAWCREFGPVVGEASGKDSRKRRGLSPRMLATRLAAAAVACVVVGAGLFYVFRQDGPSSGITRPVEPTDIPYSGAVRGSSPLDTIDMLIDAGMLDEAEMALSAAETDTSVQSATTEEERTYILMLLDDRRKEIRRLRHRLDKEGRMR